jgi:hypothetical protein
MLANAIVVNEIGTDAFGGAQVCTGCGAAPRQAADGTHEPIVATGFHIPVDGHIYFCRTCIAFLGSLVGLVDPETGKARASDVRRAQRREAAIRDAAGKTEAALDALAEATQALSEMTEVLG